MTAAASCAHVLRRGVAAHGLETPYPSTAYPSPLVGAPCEACIINEAAQRGEAGALSQGRHLGRNNRRPARFADIPPLASFRALGRRWTPALHSEGIRHGFQTLSDDVEVNYLISEPYVPRLPAATAMMI